MPFIDNKHSHVVKSTLICGAALTGIMIANPIANPIVKADTITTTQVKAPATNWIATKPADIRVDNNQKTYTLNRGDTLWAIAQATKTDVNQLAQLNNINLEAGDQYHLAIGLTIKLTADAQTENDSNNSSDNANTVTQNSAISNSSDNATTAANNSSNAETPATAQSNSAPQTTSQAETSPQSNSDTTKNGQVDTGKSQVSKPADVIHNENSAKTSGKTSSQPAASQSSTLSDGSISSQAPNSSADKTRSNTPAADGSQHNVPSSSTDNAPNDNNGNTASSSANNHSSTPASSSSKTNSKSASNVGSEPADINRDANSSSSKADSSSNSSNNSSKSSSSNNKDSSSSSKENSSSDSSSNNDGSSSSSKNNDSSSSSSSSSDDNPPDTSDTSDYKQIAPLNDDDLAKVVTLEKQLNDLQIQIDTIDNNLQFYQAFIDATKNANGDNPQDRLDKIAFQNIYYQKTVNGYSDMSDEQARLVTIKAQLPIDAQMITNLQNQLTKPNITDTEKQTLTTDLNNAKATAVKDQETYQTLQAKISWASEIVAQYKAFLARNADMTAALKGNDQANSLVTQYQKYINDNQNTQASLKSQIVDIKNQLKAYGVTLNS